MIRVVAVGNGAGNIVDQLRKNKTFPYVEFLFCDTDEEALNRHGNPEDRHIVLTPNMEKVCKDIHSDNDIATILVCCLGGKTTSKYAMEIAQELWDYSDKTYFFATIPSVIEGAMRRSNSFSNFEDVADLFDVAVLQDNDMIPEYLNMTQMDNGIVTMIESLLSSPSIDFSVDEDELPFIMTATPGQGLDALVALYNSSPQLADYGRMRTFMFWGE